MAIANIVVEHNEKVGRETITLTVGAFDCDDLRAMVKALLHPNRLESMEQAARSSVAKQIFLPPSAVEDA
jgi:hypothetical protein